MPEDALPGTWRAAGAHLLKTRSATGDSGHVTVTHTVPFAPGRRSSAAAFWSIQRSTIRDSTSRVGARPGSRARQTGRATCIAEPHSDAERLDTRFVRTARGRKANLDWCQPT